MTAQLRHPAWRKSSYSSDQYNCVQVALDGPKIGVRDSKHPDGLVLAVTSGCWGLFLTGITTGRLHR